jgi:putative ABC transport system permease protein
MRSLISHLRYTVRQLLKSPGFTVTAVLILGLGIGANTTIFSLVNGVLLKPLPYPKADRLVQIYQPFQGHLTSLLNYPHFVQYSTAQHTFESLTAFLGDGFNLQGQSGPERLSGLWVSGTFFKVLGRPFLIGRPIEDADDHPGAPAVVVLSEGFWRTKFSGDPKIVGAKLVLNAKSYQVIGVTPGQADEASTIDLYVPLAQNPDTTLRFRSGAHYFSCIGRLKDEVTLQQAKSDLEVISRNLIDKYPASAGFGIWLVSYLDSVTGDYSTTVWVLESAVFCLLLVTCANIASLLLARAQERRREITVRAALGANRVHIIAQFFSETIALAVIGGVIGLPLATSATAVVKQLVPPDIPRFQEFGVDGGSLIFVFAATIFAALASGLFPAWVASRADVSSSLKEEGSRVGTAGPRGQRGHAALVAAQVALTCLLLIAASLLTRSFVAIENVPLGFKTDHILTADLYLGDAKYSTQTVSKVFLDALVGKLEQLPGVISIGFDDNLPFKGEDRLSFGIEGQPDPEPWKLPVWQAQIVSAHFLRTLGIPLLRGRGFSEQGRNDQIREVVIALSLGHLMDSLLYQVSAIDPFSIGISVLVLGLSAFVACLLPACRATQIDPIQELRE